MINVQVERVQLTVITPGRILRARLSVEISQEGAHRPGDCEVGTRGTIVATYNDTERAANDLPNHTLRIDPWPLFPRSGPGLQQLAGAGNLWSTEESPFRVHDGQQG